MPPPAREEQVEQLAWKAEEAEEACQEWFTAVEDYLHELQQMGEVRTRRADGPKFGRQDLRT
eukprot:5301749-Pyramimonas_sp.AAC.1